MCFPWVAISPEDKAQEATRVLDQDISNLYSGKAANNKAIIFAKNVWAAHEESHERRCFQNLREKIERVEILQTMNPADLKGFKAAESMDNDQLRFCLGSFEFYPTNSDKVSAGIYGYLAQKDNLLSSLFFRGDRSDWHHRAWV